MITLNFDTDILSNSQYNILRSNFKGFEDAVERFNQNNPESEGEVLITHTIEENFRLYYSVINILDDKYNLEIQHLWKIHGIKNQRFLLDKNKSSWLD